MTHSTDALGPAAPRWTHVALRVDDIDATIAWYESFTPLRLVHRRTDESGHGAWLGHPERVQHPFVLVVAQFFPDKDPYAAAPKEVLAPFAHLGIELPSREAVDEIAQRAERAGCLAEAARQMPPPIGYICMVNDPDGNTIEFSHDQGLYAELSDRQT